MTSILRVDGLRKHFSLGHGEVVRAVNDISFKIQRGETLGLVGESGSGKTTVGRCILRLLEPTAGRIVFNEHDITELRERELRPLRPKMQLVFQDPGDALNPRMRIRDIVAEPLIARSSLSTEEVTARVREVVGLVKVRASRLDEFPHQLSGGEQQRIGIARAISTDPALVVLDEPTSKLDVSVRAEIIRLLKAVQERLGLSYLFISHDLTVVERISHRVAVMYLGQIVEMGRTAEIFRQSRHPYSRALLSAVLYPDPTISVPRFPLRGEIPSPIHLPSGCYLAPRCPLVKPECSSARPELEEVADGHSAACIRTREAQFAERLAAVFAQGRDDH